MWTTRNRASTFELLDSARTLNTLEGEQMSSKDTLGSIVTGWRDYTDDRCDDDNDQTDDDTPDGPDQGHRYELIVMWDDLTPTESELVASALGALVRRRLPRAVSTYIDHVQ